MTEERTRAEAIVENLPVGVIVVDHAMHVVHLNPTAEDIIGWALSDATGRHLHDLLGPDLRSEGSALAEAMETGQRAEPRVTTIGSESSETDGQADQRPQRRVLVGAAPFEGGYLLSLDRAGPFHRIEAERVSDLSHDMRSPLASIRAYAELLVDGVDEGDPELRQQFLDVIDQRARRLTDLIVNLTGLVRWRLGYVELVKAPISLRELAGEVVSALQAEARHHGVRLILDAAHAPDPVVGDRDALCTLLRNLIDNAITFSTAGGDVVITLRQVESHHIVRVTDSGCGIARDDIPHIFEPFYRGGNVIAAGLEGSGLGLALAKLIAEAHGGTVRVASEKGEGTSVTVTLPTGAEGSFPRPATRVTRSP